MGGVVLYINENLVSRHHEVLPDTECEAVWAKILISKNSHLLVGVCYRSRSAATEESMKLTLWTPNYVLPNSCRRQINV